MKTLLYIPQSRDIPEALHSIRAVRGVNAMMFDWSGNEPGKHRFQNITDKCAWARQHALDSGYDALLIIDDDMLVTPDIYERLAAVDAEIVYGLCVRRDGTFHWNAAHALTETSIMAYRTRPNDTIQAFGTVFPVAGVGSACTLIRRRALEQIPFQRRGEHCFDWYLAVDAQARGLRQLCHGGVQVGHIDPERHVILYATSDGYRQEAYTPIAV